MEAKHSKLRGLWWSKKKIISSLALISGYFKMATFNPISRLSQETVERTPRHDKRHKTPLFLNTMSKKTPNLHPGASTESVPRPP